MTTICPICKVSVQNLSKHLERKRCEAVKERRLFRKEIKQNYDVSSVLGKRGKRTKQRNKGAKQ